MHFSISIKISTLKSLKIDTENKNLLFDHVHGVQAKFDSYGKQSGYLSQNSIYWKNRKVEYRL